MFCKVWPFIADSVLLTLFMNSYENIQHCSHPLTCSEVVYSKQTKLTQNIQKYLHYDEVWTDVFDRHKTLTQVIGNIFCKEKSFE